VRKTFFSTKAFDIFHCLLTCAILNMMNMHMKVNSCFTKGCLVCGQHNQSYIFRFKHKKHDTTKFATNCIERKT
jgi:hypothetical protein